MPKKTTPEEKARWKAAGERLERFYAMLEERVKVDERIAAEKALRVAKKS